MHTIVTYLRMSQLEMDRYHFLPILPIRVFVLKLSADTDTDTKH